MNADCGILVNVSRAIIYASAKEDFAEQAADITKEYQKEMGMYL
jgi:orotidine-5'-phosphate decarboxylase